MNRGLPSQLQEQAVPLFVFFYFCEKTACFSIVCALFSVTGCLCIEQIERISQNFICLLLKAQLLQGPIIVRPPTQNIRRRVPGPRMFDVDGYACAYR